MFPSKTALLIFLPLVRNICLKDVFMGRRDHVPSGGRHGCPKEGDGGVLSLPRPVQDPAVGQVRLRRMDCAYSFIWYGPAKSCVWRVYLNSNIVFLLPTSCTWPRAVGNPFTPPDITLLPSWVLFKNWREPFHANNHRREDNDIVSWWRKLLPRRTSSCLTYKERWGQKDPFTEQCIHKPIVISFFLFSCFAGCQTRVCRYNCVVHWAKLEKPRSELEALDTRARLQRRYHKRLVCGSPARLKYPVPNFDFILLFVPSVHSNFYVACQEAQWMATHLLVQEAGLTRDLTWLLLSRWHSFMKLPSWKFMVYNLRLKVVGWKLGAWPHLFWRHTALIAFLSPGNNAQVLGQRHRL